MSFELFIPGLSFSSLRHKLLSANMMGEILYKIVIPATFL